MKKLLRWLGYKLWYRIVRPFYWSLLIEVHDPVAKAGGIEHPGVEMGLWYPSLKACKQDIPNVTQTYLRPNDKIMKIEAYHRLFGRRKLSLR